MSLDDPSCGVVIKESWERLVSCLDAADVLATKLRRLRKVLRKWENVVSVPFLIIRRNF